MHTVARNGIIAVALVLVGATWGEFFPPDVLASAAGGAVVALLATYIGA